MKLKLLVDIRERLET